VEIKSSFNLFRNLSLQMTRWTPTRSISIE